ncbi:MAG: asparagine synthetase B family protein, partial [Dehalococcoidia bacterium]
MAHRGPDDQGTYVAPGIGLGNRRLAILDLSTAGHQPMSTPGSGLWITYNGEIYNHRELREELERCGHQFRSKTDTEVVLAAYQNWGPACLNKFNGMFAIGIWDARHRRLFLARDRIGIKPLYYYFDGYTLLFASEMKAILADPLVPRQLNPKGVANYFTFGHSVAPDTIFHNIKKVPPGHYLMCKPDDGDKLQLRIRRYWSLPVPGLTSEDAGEEYYAERVNHLLEESVRRRLISDVP